MDESSSQVLGQRRGRGGAEKREQCNLPSLPWLSRPQHQVPPVELTAQVNSAPESMLTHIVEAAGPRAPPGVEMKPGESVFVGEVPLPSCHWLSAPQQAAFPSDARIPHVWLEPRATDVHITLPTVPAETKVGKHTCIADPEKPRPNLPFAFEPQLRGKKEKRVSACGVRGTSSSVLATYQNNLPLYVGLAVLVSHTIAQECSKPASAYFQHQFVASAVVVQVKVCPEAV